MRAIASSDECIVSNDLLLATALIRRSALLAATLSIVRFMQRAM